MKKTNRVIAFALAAVLFTGQVQGQEYYEDDCCAYAYSESGYASYLSAALPIGALAIAAILIATTNRHSHCCSSSCYSSSSQSCRSSHHHSHSGSCGCSSY